MISKGIRLNRIMDPKSKKTLIVSVDHGVTLGQIKGLVNMGETIHQISLGGANAVIVHKGQVKHIISERNQGSNLGFILHLSASTSLGPDPNDKQIISSVEHALKLGADAVSIHINIGAHTEPGMIKELGEISDTCQIWGIPLIAMMYPRGKNISDEYDEKFISHAVRVADELGADIVKTNYSGNIESFKRVIDGVNIPVIIAGGPKTDSPLKLLKTVYESLQAGGSGVSFGRNIFQYQNPVRMIEVIKKIIFEGLTPVEAMEILNPDSECKGE